MFIIKKEKKGDTRFFLLICVTFSLRLLQIMSVFSS